MGYFAVQTQASRHTKRGVFCGANLSVLAHKEGVFCSADLSI